MMGPSRSSSIKDKNTRVKLCCSKNKSSKTSFTSAKMLQSRRSSIELNKPSQETNIAAHFLDPEQLAKIYDTDLINGLTEVRAEDQLISDGPNALQQPIDMTFFKIFIHNMFSWFPCMLWIGGFLSIGIHYAQFLSTSIVYSNENIYLGTIILCVVVLTGLYGFYQELKNVSLMNGFKDLVPKYANVIRGGRVRNILSRNLVVGDLVEMNSGEMVPADVRLISVNNFRIDMSSLTGETNPQSRSTKRTSENPLDSKNLAFFSCLITEGEAMGIVVATGQQTVIGRIAGLASDLEKEETPMSKEIKRFIKILCVVGFILGIFIFFMIYLVQSNWVMCFYYMIGIIVANLPEGLLVTLKVALTLTAKKLQNKNCLVKKLESVETLGAVSCICSDKTGTLTLNRMTVSHFVFDGDIFSSKLGSLHSYKAFMVLSRASCLNLRAQIMQVDASLPGNEFTIKGDASESAVLRFMETKIGASRIRADNPKVCEIPFNSKNKYQLSIHRLGNPQNFYMVMKGAPEIIIESCSTVLFKTDTYKLNAMDRNEIKNICTTLGNIGERVLGYCDLVLSEKTYPENYIFDTENINFPMNGFRFIGLISLIDPPRRSVPDAISKCRSAGIKVIMVTGDHPVTALAISKMVGIISSNNKTPYDDAFESNVDINVFLKTVKLDQYKAVVITGDELRNMRTDRLDSIIRNVDEIIFARTTPQQKLLIVESCQRLGHVVGVTGDGVNDSPALKKADIGISMGISGTEVSKQAADVLLLDDDFSSILLGVEEGRLIYENLKKSIAFILTSNIPEMVPFMLYATIGIPLPLHALLIICINIFTDIWPAISLVYEKAEADIMKKPPRDLQSDHLVSWNLINMAYFQIGIIQMTAAMAGYFIAMACYGFYPSELFFSRDRWSLVELNDYEDSFGQEWTYEQRKKVQILSQSTYYAMIVMVQISDVIICKTRRLSLFTQRMSNFALNCGIAMETIASILILYVPPLNVFLYTYPIPWQLWVVGIPFFFFIILYDELRKFLIRKYPGRWVERELYY